MATNNWRVFTPEQSAALDRIIDEMMAPAESVPRVPTVEEQQRRRPMDEMTVNWTAFDDHEFWTQQIGVLNGRKVQQGVWYGHADLQVGDDRRIVSAYSVTPQPQLDWTNDDDDDDDDKEE